MSTDNHKEFLVREFVYFSIQAGFATRNEEYPVYDRSYEEFNLQKAKILKKDIKEYLLAYFEEINKSSITEDEHKKRIRSLATKVTKKYGPMLNEGKFRLGVAQKIINLFLKYLWTADLIKEPHHCPFDNIVKLKIQKYSEDWLSDWTEMKTIKEYEEYVKAVKTAAAKDNMSIAQWELNNWKRR